MARISSAAVIKASARGGGKFVPQDAPRPGTRVREFYDQLQANKGREIEPLMFMTAPDHAIYTAIASLRDFYGLDVRLRLSRRRRGMPPRAILVGEWVGGAYIDYMAEKSTDEIRGLVPSPEDPGHTLPQ